MLRLFHLIPETDDLLETSWLTRKWGIFVKTWLAATVGMAALT